MFINLKLRLLTSTFQAYGAKLGRVVKTWHVGCLQIVRWDKDLPRVQGSVSQSRVSCLGTKTTQPEHCCKINYQQNKTPEFRLVSQLEARDGYIWTNQRPGMIRMDQWETGSRISQWAANYRVWAKLKSKSQTQGKTIARVIKYLNRLAIITGGAQYWSIVNINGPH